MEDKRNPSAETLKNQDTVYYLQSDEETEREYQAFLYEKMKKQRKKRRLLIAGLLLCALMIVVTALFCGFQTGILRNQRADAEATVNAAKGLGESSADGLPEPEPPAGNETTPAPTGTPVITPAPTAVPTPTPTATPMPYPDAPVKGEIVTFGRYEQDKQENGLEEVEWIVLDRKGNYLLLVSEKILAFRTLHDNCDMGLTWEASKLCGWLNDAFFHDLLTDEEQQFVCTATMETYQPYEEGTMDVDSGNRVFILSEEEVLRYFTLETKICEPTQYAAAGYPFDESKQYYFLRDIHDFFQNMESESSVSDLDGFAACGPEGTFGVRPALWVSAAYFSNEE